MPSIFHLVSGKAGSFDYYEALSYKISFGINPKACHLYSLAVRILRLSWQGCEQTISLFRVHLCLTAIFLNVAFIPICEVLTTLTSCVFFKLFAVRFTMKLSPIAFSFIIAKQSNCFTLFIIFSSYCPAIYPLYLALLPLY